MSIKKELEGFRQKLPENVQLIAVSKTKSASAIQEAYATGQRDFGENRIQEMTEKWEQLPKDIKWHMIGHTQRNKVKYMAPYVHLIHSVDSPRLLKEINKQAKSQNRTIDCLLQLHIAKEDSKYGFDKEELLDFITSEAFTKLKHVRVEGLMGMATFTDNEDQIHSEFRELHNLFKELKSSKAFSSPHELKTLSIGMSGDYKIAIDNGSTMVRVGSAIFGSRD